MGFLSASSNLEAHPSNFDQIKQQQMSRSSTALRGGEGAGGGGLVSGERKRMKREKTTWRRRRRAVEQSPLCTILRKNWRSKRAVLLMPVIKMGAGRVEMGLVCEMEAHTHIHIHTPLKKKRPRFRFKSFHGRFLFSFYSHEYTDTIIIFSEIRGLFD